MKKFISVVLGLAAGMSTTFGQGYIRFENYNSHAGDGAQTTFGTGVAAHIPGLGLTSGWTAGLLYSTSPVIDAATANSADAAASLNGAWSVASITAVYASSIVGGAQGFYAGNFFSFCLTGLRDKLFISKLSLLKLEPPVRTAQSDI